MYVTKLSAHNSLLPHPPPFFFKLNSELNNSNTHLFPLGLSQKMASEDASSSASSLISKFKMMNAELDHLLEEDSPEVNLLA
jgi:hypothetical protein